MSNKVELNILVEERILALFNQLCEQENKNLDQVLSDYMAKCIKVEQLLSEKDLESAPDNIQQIIDERIAVALEKQKSQIEALIKEQIKQESGKLGDRTLPIPSHNKKTAVNTAQTVIDKKDPLVMIVDDSMTVRELFALSFSREGYRVEKARDGQEAWEKLQSGCKCDIIFCDIEMPRMDGLELLANLKKDQKLSRIPVAMLTSFSEEQHQKRAATLGASGYFTKPYAEEELLSAADRMLKGDILLDSSTSEFSAAIKSKLEASTQASTPLPSPHRAPRPQRTNSKPSLLIIDDSIIMREMVSMTFTKVGYDVKGARDGQDALEKLQSGLYCDLILCDIEMPRMNGLEFLSRIQEDPELSEIPVAMLTSRGAQKMKQIAAQRGAKGYFVKPYVEKTLIQSVKRLLDGEILLENEQNIAHK